MSDFLSILHPFRCDCVEIMRRFNLFYTCFLDHLPDAEAKFEKLGLNGR